MLKLRCISVLLLVIPVSYVAADTPPGFHRMQIGEAAPDFTLPGIDGRDWSLADFRESKVLVVYFTSNHCPVCHAHDPRFLALLKELSGQSVSVVAINPNSGDGLRPDELGYSKYDDSFEHMKLYAADEGFTFPYLYDGETQTTAKNYGCLASMDSLIEALDPAWEGPQPHTVLVAPGGKLVFRHNGKIEEEELLSAILEEMTTAYQPTTAKK